VLKVLKERNNFSCFFRLCEQRELELKIMDDKLYYYFNTELKRKLKYPDVYEVESDFIDIPQNYGKLISYNYKIIPEDTTRLSKLIKNTSTKSDILKDIKSIILKHYPNIKTFSFDIKSGVINIKFEHIDIPLILDLPVYSIIGAYLELNDLLRYMNTLHLDADNFWLNIFSFRFPQLVYPAKYKVEFDILYEEIINFIRIYNLIQDYDEYIDIYSGGDLFAFMLYEFNPEDMSKIISRKSLYDNFERKLYSIKIKWMPLVYNLWTNRPLYKIHDTLITYECIHKYLIWLPGISFTYSLNSSKFTVIQIVSILSNFISEYFDIISNPKILHQESLINLNEDDGFNYVNYSSKLNHILNMYQLPNEDIKGLIYQIINEYDDIKDNVRLKVYQNFITILLDNSELKWKDTDEIIRYMIDIESIPFGLLDILIKDTYDTLDKFLIRLKQLQLDYDVKTKFEQHYHIIIVD
jgi:hypothetical protein